MTQSKIYGVTSALIDYLDKYNDSSIMRALTVSSSIVDRRALKIYPVMFKFMPDNYLSKTGIPTYAENAVFLALKIYAILNCQIDNTSFFQALASVKNSAINLDSRVSRLLMTSNFNAISISLPAMAKILKANNAAISVDIPALANDLHNLQFDYNSQKRVALKWGQDYYRIHNTETNHLETIEE